MLKLSSKKIAVLAALVTIASQAQAGPAPYLTNVKVIRVSSSAGTEFPSSGQLLTTLDHTSTNLKVTVRLTGYGSNYIAKMNGSTISNSNITSVLLCGSASNPTPCSNGQTVVAFDETYTITGYSSGKFTFQATGINGGGTKSTFINIK